MKFLSSCIDARDNHFNAIRIVAASAVLVSHSFAIATGDSRLEPLRQSLGVTPGALAVDVFFTASGLLLANSLNKKQDAVDFIVSRIARIYPALIVITLLTVFVLGSYFTSLPLHVYFGSGETHTYLLKTATLIRDVGYTLPGVFHELPLRDQVNGPLWTLPIEIRMYALLFVAWAACGLLGPRHRALGLRIAALALVVVAGGMHLALYLQAGIEPATKGLSRFVFFFFSGCCFALFQRRIPLGAPLLVACLVLLVASSLSATAFFFAWHLLIGYTVLLLAYQRLPLLGHYNKLGDYSYGMYIYAWPIQQSLVALIPGISIAALTGAAFTLTLLMAVLSWHWVERPCMDLKTRFIRRYRARRAARAALSATIADIPRE
ncbi:MAG: acyltransferase [Burkholderiaceae bacterium]